MMQKHKTQSAMNKATAFYAMPAAFGIYDGNETETIWVGEARYMGFLEFLTTKNPSWRIAGEKDEPYIVIIDDSPHAKTVEVEPFLNEYIGKEVLAYWNEYTALSATAPKYYACSAAHRVVDLTDEERETRTSRTIEVLPDAPFAVGVKVVQTNPFRMGEVVEFGYRDGLAMSVFYVMVLFDGGITGYFTSEGKQRWNASKGRVLYVCAEQ